MILKKLLKSVKILCALFNIPINLACLLSSKIWRTEYCGEMMSRGVV